MGPSIAQWQSCHILHKLGAFGIILSTLLFLVGFSVPAWTTHSGLWMRCSSSICTSNIHSHSDAWINIVRVVECIALLAFVLCALTEILQTCFLQGIHPPYNRSVEILAVVAGMTGVTGSAVFGIRWSTDKIMFSTLVHSSSLADKHSSSLQWGFGMVIAASIIILLSAVAVGYSHHSQEQSVFAGTKMSVPKTSERLSFDEQASFCSYENPDSLSMMFIPVSHIDSNRTSNDGRSDPPAYALPPLYPYPSNCSFFVPVANFSVMPHIVDTSSIGIHSRVMGNMDQSLSLIGTDSMFTSSPDTFISPASTFYVHKKHPVMQQLFVKTSDGGSEIEITPSAQNSSGLPSPFNHF